MSSLHTNEIVKNYFMWQKAGEILPCPRCGDIMKPTLLRNALSRRADIYVCSRCGIREALEDMCKANNPDFVKLPIENWSFMNDMVPY